MTDFPFWVQVVILVLVGLWMFLMYMAAELVAEKLQAISNQLEQIIGNQHAAEFDRQLESLDKRRADDPFYESEEQAAYRRERKRRKTAG